MKAYQRQFIEFALEKQVLKFGEFTLKSGRKSPYFFNAGLFNSGRDLARLGRFYAAALMDAGIEFDVLFGPAYKDPHRFRHRGTTGGAARRGRPGASTARRPRITAKAAIWWAARSRDASCWWTTSSPPGPPSANPWI